MMDTCPRDQAVTLLSFGPRTSRPAPSRSNKKSEKFSFKFRRRSKSAPRHQNTDKDISGKITYSANGETKVKNPDSPFKSDSVELVGFRGCAGVSGPGGSCHPSWRSVDTDTSVSGHCVSLDSADTSFSSVNSVNTLERQYKALSDSRTLSRTSKDIKMERERLRQERLASRSGGLHLQMSGPSSAASSQPLNKLSIFSHSNLANDRSKLLEDAAREMLDSDEILTKFLREREERLGRGVGAGAFSDRSNQLISAGVSGREGGPMTSSENNSDIPDRTGERIIPITISRDTTNSDDQSATTRTRDQVSSGQQSGQVRIIPVMVETGESSDSGETVSSSTESNDSGDSTPCQEEQMKMPGFPSLLSDMKLTDSMLKPGRTSFHHPSFANHFGFARLRPDDQKSIFTTGIRDSFPGFPNFGNFPSFTPLLAGDRPFPDRAHFRDKSKVEAIHKQRLGKSKSSVDYSSDKPSETFRYANGDGDAHGTESIEPYGDSESESEDDDLDSVSVIADRSRDRLSGTGSTHSHDSGISEEASEPVQPRIRIRLSESGRVGAGARRPDSAVPSEYSLVSDTSSCEGSDDKIFRLSEARPLVVPSSKGDQVPGVTNESSGTGDQEQDVARTQKAFVIASELVKTEIHYVAILHLIDQVFHFRVDQENRAHHMFGQEVITTIFSNIKSIYKFHAEFLLPQLQERMTKWTDGPEHQRIGDIMVKNAPFLKMYTEYVKNFDTAMTTINNFYAKNSKFAAIVDEIHSMSECENLTLQHHMLTPIQRIPRYEMLLKDYCQKLPENSPDRQDSESALIQVSQAAAHANDSMKRIEQFKKLLEVQESIGGSIDLVSPTREVLKEGKIVKISARTGDHQDRYLFLLSDLLLLCSPRKSMISGPQFSLRAKFDVDNLQVLEGDNLVTANTFYVRDDTKSVELYTGTRRDKEDWLEVLYLAIQSLYTRKSSLRVGRDILRPLDSEIGKKQPHMQKLDNVQKCTECSVQFSILKHKHNCRFCGAVFCSKCSDCRYPLPWDDGKKARICRSCHQVLTNQTNLQPITELPVRPKGLLEVPASTPSVHSGWLVLRPPGSKSSSTKRFFILLSDFVLYSFRTEVDTSALTATPLPGFTIATGAGLKGDSGCSDKDRDKVIKMFHPSSKRTYYFAGNSPVEVERWAEMLSMASKAEVPSSSSSSNTLSAHVDETQSTSSTEYENG